MNRKIFISNGLYGAAGLMTLSLTSIEKEDATFDQYEDNVSKSLWIDHIPAIYVVPDKVKSNNHLVIWQDGFTGSKSNMVKYLIQLAEIGYTAVSFDNWEHGERGKESATQIWDRVFSAFRRNMWPIIGNSAIDALRVIDYFQTEYNLSKEVFIGGISMGGDISVAAAALDKRIKCVSAIISTPDWTRPGMHGFDRKVIDQGVPDAYANFFYDRLNPITHIENYSHLPAIRFECGAEDTHVPNEAAFRFQKTIENKFGSPGCLVEVNLHKNTKHEVTAKMWDNSLEWFNKHL